MGKIKDMKKYIRTLEAPLYLFIIAIFLLEVGETNMAIFIGILSVARLIVNASLDEFIYKR